MRKAAVSVGFAATLFWLTSGWGLDKITPADIRQNLFSACFITEQEGWIIGDLGRILYTTDQGRTLERLDAGTKRAFASLACFPDKTLVMVGKSGVIYRSSDGGRAWQEQKSGVERNLLAVSFANKDVGLAVGDAGTILRTGDGGASWTKIPVPEQVPLPEEAALTIAPGDILLYDVNFVSPERAWVVGEFGVILTTHDGGLTWTAQHNTIQSTLFGVYFADENNGWAVGISSVMLRTRDGGETWESVNPPRRLGFDLSLYEVAVRGQYGWAVGDSGFLLTSKDAGDTWDLAEVPIQLAGTWFRGIGLAPGGTGVLVGAEGLILATKGSSFTPLRKL
jgi:photosystem II stability/assembly factor-like uncharacterized protein